MPSNNLAGIKIQPSLKTNSLWKKNKQQLPKDPNHILKVGIWV